MSKVVFAFGRFNPPHIGTEKLFDEAKKLAIKEKAAFKIYVSHTQDNKKNPLDYKSKIKYLKYSFPEYAGNITVSENHTIYDILKELSRTYKSVILVVGEDRVEQFKKAIEPYINPDHPDAIPIYDFKVVSAGDRASGSDRVERMSGTKLRQFAKDNNFDAFALGVPAKLTEPQARQLFQLVRKGLGLTESINKPIEENSMADKDYHEKAYDNFRQFFVKMMDEEDSHKNQPDSDFLVVDKKSGERHLPVKKNGTPDHGLMGAAFAALTKNYRGRSYEGPNKGEALSKLKALYKREKLELPKE